MELLCFAKTGLALVREFWHKSKFKDEICSSHVLTVSESGQSSCRVCGKKFGLIFSCLTSCRVVMNESYLYMAELGFGEGENYFESGQEIEAVIQEIFHEKVSDLLMHVC